MTDIQQALLPCPFCGSMNIRMHKDSIQMLYCGNCRQQGPAVPSLSGVNPPTDEEKAIVLMMWNHRKSVKADNDSVKADKVGQTVEKDQKLTLNGIQIQ